MLKEKDARLNKEKEQIKQTIVDEENERLYDSAVTEKELFEEK